MKADVIKRLIATVAVLVLIGFLCLLTVRQCNAYAPTNETIRTACMGENGYSYLYYETATVSEICKVSGSKIVDTKRTDNAVDFKGNVKALRYGDGMLYALYEDDGIFGMVIMDKDMNVKRIRELVDDADYEYGGLQVAGSNIYLTLLKDGFSRAVVYQISETSDECVSIVRQSAEGNMHYVCAYFKDGKLQAKYSDNSTTDDYEAQDADLSVPKNSRWLGLKNGIFVVVRNSVYLACMALIVIFICETILKRKSFAARRIIVTLLVIAGCMVITGISLEDVLLSKRTDERVEYAEGVLKDCVNDLAAYDGSFGTNPYSEAYLTVSKAKDSFEYVDDILIVNGTSEALVTIEKDIPYGEKLCDLWKGDINAAMKNAKSTMRAQSCEVTINGIKKYFVISPWPDDFNAEKFIACVLDVSDIEKEAQTSILFVYERFALIWLLGMLILSIMFIYDAIQLRFIQSAMAGVSKGSTTRVEKPNGLSRDYDRMWNSLVEISKGMNRNIYAKDKIYQAYYRFAPKGLENLLKRVSVSDIQKGDMVSADGLVATFKICGSALTDRQNYVKKMDAYINMLCEAQKDSNTVIIPDGSNLDSIIVLFNNTDKNVLLGELKDFLTVLNASEDANKNIHLLLHKVHYVYSVTGTDEQVFSCVGSTELDGLETFEKALGELNLKMVITEQAMKAIGSDFNYRYIGFYELKNIGTNIKLYEVIDASAVKDRKLKLDTKSDFDKALNLYYKNDFYLARNLFADVIKLNPRDMVARWYLFSCEKMLDATDMNEFKYGLLSDK